MYLRAAVAALFLIVVDAGLSDEHCVNYQFIDDHVAGDPANPFAIAQGCFYDFIIPPQGALYLVQEQKNTCTGCDLFQEWYGLNLPGKVMAMFSWDPAPAHVIAAATGGEGGSDSTTTITTTTTDANGDSVADEAAAASAPEWRQTAMIAPDYQWGMQMHLDSGEHVYRAHLPANESVFHCQGLYCMTHSENRHTGPLYITLKSHADADDVYGVYASKFDTSNKRILKEQLLALEDLWRACCESASDLHVANPLEHTSVCHWNVLKDPFKSWADVTTESCDDMEHVTCDAMGNVVSLDLDNMGLKCPSLPAMDAFPELRSVRMVGNQIGGSIPSALAGSRVLELIDLADNDLTGPLPCFESTALQSIYLNNNHLTGPLPRCFGSLLHLKELDLSDNYLTGRVPSPWRNLQRLEVLLLARLQLTGNVPTALQNLHNLYILDMSRNRLTGTIPDYLLSELTLLHHIDLSFNKLTGHLPAIQPSMKELTTLYLNDNLLEGRISTQLDLYRQSPGPASHKEIAHVKLGHNRFSGRLHAALHAAIVNMDLDLSGNLMSCDDTTGGWPVWARYSPVQLGTCLPEPNVQSVSPHEVTAGGYVDVVATNLLQSENLKCVFGDKQASTQADAVFVGRDKARCKVPDSLEGDVPIVITNMGSYYEPTITSAAEPLVRLTVLHPGMGDLGSSPPMHNGLAVLITLLVILIILTILYACMLRRKCLWAKRGLAVATDDEQPINRLGASEGEGLELQHMDEHDHERHGIGGLEGLHGTNGSDIHV